MPLLKLANGLTMRWHIDYLATFRPINIWRIAVILYPTQYVGDEMKV